MYIPTSSIWNDSWFKARCMRIQCVPEGCWVITGLPRDTAWCSNQVSWGYKGEYLEAENAFEITNAKTNGWVRGTGYVVFKRKYD